MEARQDKNEYCLVQGNGISVWLVAPGYDGE